MNKAFKAPLVLQQQQVMRRLYPIHKSTLHKFVFSLLLMEKTEHHVSYC